MFNFLLSIECNISISQDGPSSRFAPKLPEHPRGTTSVSIWKGIIIVKENPQKQEHLEKFHKISHRAYMRSWTKKSWTQWTYHWQCILMTNHLICTWQSVGGNASCRNFVKWTIGSTWSLGLKPPGHNKWLRHKGRLSERNPSRHVHFEFLWINSSCMEGLLLCCLSCTVEKVFKKELPTVKLETLIAQHWNTSREQQSQFWISILSKHWGKRETKFPLGFSLYVRASLAIAALYEFCSAILQVSTW